MASAYETLVEIFGRAMRRGHSVLGCQHALRHHMTMTLDRPNCYRLAEELVDGAEEFFESMGKFPPHHRLPPGLKIQCCVCGSLLCPTYGAVAALTNMASPPTALSQMLQHLLKLPGKGKEK